MKKLRILLLLIDILLLGVSIYYKQSFLAIFFVIMFFYIIYIFLKKTEYTTPSHFNTRSIYSNNIFLFLAIILLMRFIFIQGYRHEYYQNESRKQVERKDIFSGNRGNIYDNKGIGLAYNKNIYTLGVNPSALYDREKTIEGIKEILDEPYIKADKEKILKILEAEYQKGSKYKVIAKKLTDLDKANIEKIIKKYGMKLNEIQFDRVIERNYYKKDLYHDLIGFIGYSDKNPNKKIGIFGIEKQYENYLKERVAERRSFYNMKRDMKLPSSKENVKINLNGCNVYTTIEDELQFILNEEVKDKFVSSGSEEAYGIIMDTNSGKILATASYSVNKKALRNPIFQNQFEPGSTFKPIVVAYAMDKGIIRENSSFDVGNGTIKKFKHTIKESSRSTHGILSTKEVLKKSSNVGMVLISDNFSNEEFEKFLKEFGFYDKTEIDFPGELKPFATPYKKWDGLKKYTMSFGQGIVVTPIQLVTAFSATINGGILYKPYLVDKITDENGVVIRRNVPTEVRRVISEDTSKKLRAMLQEVVDDGTGKKGKVEGYTVGGKTGTAQLSSNGKYLKENYLASFIGFFPAEKPKYTILVMFLKPKGESVYERYGGATAAPVFGNIVKRITKAKNILSSNVSNITKSDIKNEHTNDLEFQTLLETEMPDLTGLSPKDVLYIFKDTNIEVKIKGIGNVVEQKPKKGTKIEDVKEVTIMLE